MRIRKNKLRYLSSRLTFQRRLKAYFLVLLASGIYACAPDRSGTPATAIGSIPPVATSSNVPQLKSSNDILEFVRKNVLPGKKFTTFLNQYRTAVKSAYQFLKSNGKSDVTAIIKNLKATSRSVGNLEGGNGLAYINPEMEGYVRYQIHSLSIRVAKHHEKAVGSPLFSKRLSDQLQDDFVNDQKTRDDLNVKSGELRLKETVLFWTELSRSKSPEQDLKEYLAAWDELNTSSNAGGSKDMGMIALLAHEKEMSASIQPIFGRLNASQKERLAAQIDFGRVYPLLALMGIDWEASKILP